MSLSASPRIGQSASPAPRTPSSSRPTALVTGAGQRLGAEIARALAQAGWAVAIHYRQSAAPAHALVQALQADGHAAACFGLDLDALQTPEAADDFLAQVQAVLGPVGLLVNSASRFELDLPETLEAAGLMRHLQSNLCAPILLTQALHRDCQKTSDPSPGPQAAVINLLDQKLANPNPDFFSYTLSKAALAEATQLMARAFAPSLRVLAVSPGITLPSADQTQAEFERAHQQTPLGQSSTAQEVADAVVWLAQARAVTGTNLLVDGGQHLLPTTRDILFLSRHS